MDLKHKLKNFPHVYYFNLDNRTDRRKYMEDQFERWNITDYTRVSGTKYLASKKDEWKHLIVDYENFNLLVPIAANAISHLSFLKDWYKNTDDEYLILMEDDYDLSLIEYWHFDWDYLMNKIPYDWDCIQMGYENPLGLRFYLHPIDAAHDFGPCMLNRNYVEKLLRLHCVDDRYKLINTVCSAAWNRQEDVAGSGTVDYFMCHPGKTYTIPLITTNPDFGSFENHSRVQHNIYRQGGDVMARNTYYYWWKNERDKFTLDEFFTYGKPNDYLMVYNPTKYRNYDYKK
jgi:hypothetical protein